MGAVLFLAALVTGSTLAWQRPSLLNSASQPDMPPARLAEITEQALAGSDYDVLARLAENPEVTIRASVARNPQTPAAIAEKLASDPESSVRHWVITHPGLSHETLERLAADRDEIVRRNATAVLGRVSGKLE